MGNGQRGFARMDVCIGVAIVALGAVLALGLGDISFGAGYDRIGPRFFPYVVACGLLVLSAWFLAAGFARSDAPAPHDAGAITNWIPIAYLAASLILTLLLLERAGFVVACAIQFWLVARAFGSQQPLRDAAVGYGLALICFLAFANGLGLTLPAGILEGVL